MIKVKAQPIETDIAFSKDREIVRVDYSHGDLRAFVRDTNTESEVIVDFYKVLGFRVLDEGYFMEFWPECSTPNGWLSQKANSYLVDMNPKANEYLIAGENDCLSVICLDAPGVRIQTL